MDEREIPEKRGVRISLPTQPGKLDSDHHFRVELPLYPDSDTIVYMGLNEDVRSNWQIEPHYHSHFELCYIDQGQGWFSVGDYLYKIAPGDMFVTKPFECHEGAFIGEMPLRLYYAGFQFRHMKQLEIPYYEFGPTRVAQDTGGVVHGLFAALLEEFRKMSYAYVYMAEGLLMQLLVATLRTYKEASSLSGDKGLVSLTPLLREVLNYLHDHAYYHESMEPVAARFHISRSHLDKEFKACMGTSLGRYLRKLCIQRAQYGLRETTESVTEIAEKLRYPSIHHFSIFFKKQTGMSPLAYRMLTGGKNGREREG